ncbi:MAG: YHS domain-containing (seleno)protein [Phycisphaerales bacterium]
MLTVLPRVVVASSLFFLAGSALAQPAASAPVQYNVGKDKLAIEGYDPVAYFPEGGGKPAKGDAKFSHVLDGVSYRFDSQAHLDLFKANPAKYEPAHGGWCTYAMGKNGEKVEVDPKSFVVDGGRLFLFYKGTFNDTRKSFLKDQPNLTSKADLNWKKLSGEEPRTGMSSALQKQLDEVKAKYSASMPEEQQKVFADAMKEVAASGVMESALKVGAVAPDFMVTDAKGRSLHLADMLKTGPVVLTWYRGGWCPYCNLQLKAMEEVLPEITHAGGTLIAMSPEKPDGTMSTAEKDALTFSVVSDTGLKVAHQYGLAYTLPSSLQEMFKGRLDLPAINGEPSWELPLAATYVVGMDGKVAYAFVDADYTKRAEPAAVLAAVKRAKRGG